MAIVLGKRKYGRYTTVCQLRAPGDASGRCGDPGLGMRAGRRWAACKGVRSNLRVLAQPKAQPVVPLLALPARRSSTVEPKVLWAYLGRMNWKLWKGLLERAGVERTKTRGRGRRFTHAECRRVMETRFRELGEQRLNRKR